MLHLRGWHYFAWLIVPIFVLYHRRDDCACVLVDLLQGSWVYVESRRITISWTLLFWRFLLYVEVNCSLWKLVLDDLLWFVSKQWVVLLEIWLSLEVVLYSSLKVTLRGCDMHWSLLVLWFCLRTMGLDLLKNWGQEGSIFLFEFTRKVFFLDLHIFFM